MLKSYDGMFFSNSNKLLIYAKTRTNLKYIQFTKEKTRTKKLDLTYCKIPLTLCSIKD